MKKVVLFSLLVLIFPTAALADTFESVPDELTTTDQEQVTESTSISEVVTSESQAPASSETQASVEPTVESEVENSEELTAPQETPVVDEAFVESATTEAIASSSENVEEKIIPSATAVANRSLAVAPKKVTPEEIAEKTKPILTFQEDYLITEMKYTWQIREVLTNSQFKIDQAELNGYTDQELENAFNLLACYSNDITYMDWSGYIRILRMVYRDNVLSWPEVEKALTFVSSNYDTVAELTKDIDQLQFYLRTLHSSKEGFLPLRHFTNDELLQILNSLSGFEEELSKGQPLFAGILHWLYNSQDENYLNENGIKLVPPIESLSLSTESISPIATSPISVNVLDNTAQAQQATVEKEYPKTGESNTFPLTIIGTVFLFITGFAILERRFRI